MRVEIADRLCAGHAAPPPDLAALIARLAEGAGLPDWTVALAWIEDEPMTELNGRYRGKDKVTDVLSFSYLEQEGAGEPALARGAAGARTDLWPAAGAVPGEPVGEIVIATEFVAARCAENGWPLRDEIALLAVHGLLHVLGWDHEDPAEAAGMRELETELLAREGIDHPLRGKGDRI